MRFTSVLHQNIILFFTEDEEKKKRKKVYGLACITSMIQESTTRNKKMGGKVVNCRKYTHCTIGWMMTALWLVCWFVSCKDNTSFKLQLFLTAIKLVIRDLLYMTSLLMLGWNWSLEIQQQQFAWTPSEVEQLKTIIVQMLWVARHISPMWF